MVAGSSPATSESASTSIAPGQAAASLPPPSWVRWRRTTLISWIDAPPSQERLRRPPAARRASGRRRAAATSAEAPPDSSRSARSPAGTARAAARSRSAARDRALVGQRMAGAGRVDDQRAVDAARHRTRRLADRPHHRPRRRSSPSLASASATSAPPSHAATAAARAARPVADALRHKPIVSHAFSLPSGARGRYNHAAFEGGSSGHFRHALQAGLRRAALRTRRRLGAAGAGRHPLDAARAGDRRLAHPLLRDRGRRHRRRDAPGAGHGLQGGDRAPAARRRQGGHHGAGRSRQVARRQARRAVPRVRQLRRSTSAAATSPPRTRAPRRRTWTSCAQTTKHVLGTSIDKGGSGDPSPFTALGCRRGIEAVAHHVFGKARLEGAARRGAGRRPRRRAPGARAGAGGRPPHHLRRRCRPPHRRWPPSSAPRSSTSTQILEVDCDIVSPCALGGALTEALVPRAQVQGGGRRGQQPAAHARGRQGALRARHLLRARLRDQRRRAHQRRRGVRRLQRGQTRARRRWPSTTPSPRSSSGPSARRYSPK